MSDYEKVLKQLRSFGPFQRRVFILVSMFETPAAWAMLLPMLVNAEPKWRCVWDFLNTTDSNSTMKSGNCQSQDGITCPKFQFNDDFTSIVSEWDLVCERENRASITTTIQMVGVFVGAFITGQLADMFGRRKILFLEYALMLMVSGISAFMPYWELYAACRFFICGLVGGIMVVNFILPLEFVTPSWRTFCGCIGFWAVGLSLLALWGYFIRDWRMLTLSTAITGLPMLLSWWFVPESPRWLLSKGRQEEAKKIIEDMAKYNAVSVPDLSLLEGFVKNEQMLQSRRKQFTYVDLFKTKTAAKNTLIVMYSWFVSSSVYYGLNFNTRNLAGDRYINIVLAGVVEIPSLLFVLLVNNRIGRRKTTAFLMFVAGSSCISILILDLIGKMESWKTAVIVLAMVGKSGIAGGWAGVQVFSAETFPTVIRNIGYAACSMAARIGGVVAPQFVNLGRTMKPLPFAIFGFFALLCSGLLILLPETSGKPLQDVPSISNNGESEQMDNIPGEHELTENKV